ncbi:hypothetical protein QBC42DRAFT_289831 [Cladorrhinum samala]|uniref:DUF7587 domain-containing protein n=1 Tax=Cladorrhinum samala TaxID=585594 RepID=A0AAV9HGG6_9PEZI|nr:hypothetical protein QBC42DRAFT_289831 [Cladorrhinum samala]
MRDYSIRIRCHNLPWSSSDSDRDITLYHVFDGSASCQTPYIAGKGIKSGKDCRPLDPGQTCILRSAKIVRRHLDWSNRTPTHFISLWDDYDTAAREARRRADAGTHGRVGIVRVSLRGLVRNARERGGVVFRPYKVVRASRHAPRTRRAAAEVWKGFPLSRKEWLAYGEVPQSCVAGVEYFEGAGARYYPRTEMSMIAGFSLLSLD